MTEAKRQLAIRRKHLIDFRRYLKLEGMGYTVCDYLTLNSWELREYIESQWLDGMNWDNYGVYWVVDHIVPLKYFDLSDIKQASLCWNYNNLKPTYYWDNHAKGYCLEVTANELMGLPMSIPVKMLLEFVADKIDMFEQYY